MTAHDVQGGTEDGRASAAAEIRSRLPDADPIGELPDVHPGRIPRHVAIIMDGNGRWAKERGFPRPFGHRSGAASVRAVVTAAGRIGVEYLTLYSFSSENWKRSAVEIESLMELCKAYCAGEAEHLQRENVRARVIGRRGELPGEVRGALEELEAATAGCTGATLCLAINYGGRGEIADAAKRIAEEVAAGTLSPEDVDEHAVADRLYTAGMPEPDLLIRTGGELRLSNYLLWQLSYSELYVTPTLWPDFDGESFKDAIREYAGRQRRYGSAEPAESVEPAEQVDAG